MKLVVLVSFLNLSLFIYSQDDDLANLVNESMSESDTKNQEVFATFKTTRLINLTTIEQVKKGELDFRIAHRFGDLAGSAGGGKTLFGLDQISDIRFSFDYGISNRWAIGIGRSKGAYALSQLWDLNTKFKILKQGVKKSPLSLSAFGSLVYTSMPSTSISTDITNFDHSIAHRFQYFGQILLARKFNENFSLIIAPSVVHRNLVKLGDNNTQFAVALGARYKISKRAAIIADYYQLINISSYQKSVNYIPPIGLGFELETGGHVFHILLSNNGGLIEQQFLTETKQDPTLGQIRLGFNISRVFSIIKDK